MAKYCDIPILSHQDGRITGKFWKVPGERTRAGLFRGALAVSETVRSQWIAAWEIGVISRRPAPGDTSPNLSAPLWPLCPARPGMPSRFRVLKASEIMTAPATAIMDLVLPGELP